MRRDRKYRPDHPEGIGTIPDDDLHWYVGLVASNPAIGGEASILRRYLPEGSSGALREERAASIIAHAGRDEDVQVRVPIYRRDPRVRSPVGRKRISERLVIFSGYLFMGVPSGCDPRAHGFAPDVRSVPALTGFLSELYGTRRLPKRLSSSVITRLCFEADVGTFDETRESRRVRASRLKAGATVSIAAAHPFLAGEISEIEKIDGEGRVHLTIGRVRVSLAPEEVSMVDGEGAGR